MIDINTLQTIQSLSIIYVVIYYLVIYLFGTVLGAPVRSVAGKMWHFCFRSVLLNLLLKPLAPMAKLLEKKITQPLFAPPSLCISRGCKKSGWKNFRVFFGFIVSFQVIEILSATMTLAYCVNCGILVVLQCSDSVGWAMPPLKYCPQK